MGRKRKQANSDLPKGVYRTKAGLFEGKKISKKVQVLRVGPFSTPEEAEYELRMLEYGNHWGIKDTGTSFGFVYLVTHRETGKEYVGKKQFFYWDGPRGGYKCSDPSDEDWWDPKAWRSGNWETYMTSSLEIQGIIREGNPWDFTWVVLELCYDVLDLHKNEMYYQEGWNVLEALDEDGSYHYYNKNIAGLLFRPPFLRAEIKAAQAKTAEGARNYYLRPHLDRSGCVVAFEDKEAAVHHIVDNSRPLGGTFEDIR